MTLSYGYFRQQVNFFVLKVNVSRNQENWASKGLSNFDRGKIVDNWIRVQYQQTCRSCWLFLVRSSYQKWSKEGQWMNWQQGH